MMKQVLLAVTLFTSGCTNLFYYPTRPLDRTPTDLGLEFDRVTIDTKGEPALVGWFLPSRGEAKGTVLFFHGNAFNISNHVGNVHWLPENRYQVFIFDYRGYGDSEGDVSVSGVHEDAARMIGAVVHDPRVDTDTLYLLGQSLGGAMALYTAAQPEFRGVFRGIIADSPFSSFRRIAREKLGRLWVTFLFQWPLSFLVSDAYSPDRMARDITAPVLLVHGLLDTTVPPRHSERLCTLLAERCSRLEVPGIGHNQTLAHPDVRKRIIEFLETTPPRGIV